MGELLTGMLSQPLWVFLSVLARLSPPLMMAPPTRSTAVPRRIRVLIAICAALLATPIVMSNASVMPGNVLTIALSLGAEVILGVLLGSTMLLAVTSLQIAGQAIGHLAGFDLATAADPSSEEDIPVISNLLGWVAIIILLILGGHRVLMDCCLQSFEKYPVGEVVFATNWLEEFQSVLSQTFVIGVRAAAPLATALLLANLVTGLLARTLPQLNVLAIGFNINALALLMLLMMSIGSIAWVYQQELSVWLDSCRRIVEIET